MNRATPQSGGYSCTTYIYYAAQQAKFRESHFKNYLHRLGTKNHDRDLWLAWLKLFVRTKVASLAARSRFAFFLSSLSFETVKSATCTSYTPVCKNSLAMHREIYRRYHPPQARGFMHILASLWACHHTVQASRCGSYVGGRSMWPACGHMYGDWGRKIVTRIGGSRG